MTEQVTTAVHVVQPDQGESFWQPVLANGYAEVRVYASEGSGVRSFATGIQVIAPGSYIREHVHPAREELLFLLRGEGEATRPLNLRFAFVGLCLHRRPRPSPLHGTRRETP